MASRQRGDSWQVDFSNKSTRIRKDGFPSKGEADQWERDERSRLALGIPASAIASGRCDSLQALFEATYERHWRGSKAEASATINANDVLSILGKDRHPSSVTVVAIDSLISELKRKGNSGGTINRKLAALSKMLHHGHSRGWLPSLPKIERQKESEHRIRWLTDDEEKGVLAWFTVTSRVDMADLVTILVDTGLRLSEALGLTWPDTADGWLRVWGSDSKNGKSRSIPQTPRVRGVIARRKAAAIANDPYLFRVLDVHSAEYQWRAMREALGFEQDTQFVMHMLRHTFCSRLAQRGVQIQTIQQLAGHKSIQMTMRYSHLCPSNLQDAIKTLAL